MEIEINGVIGYDVLSKDIISKLKEANGKDVTVNIHSPGGSVFEGVAIYNAIKNYSGKVKIKVNGLAASMASIIALARGKFETAKSSIYMIHNARGFAVGDQNAISKYAEMLKSISDLMAKIYAENTGRDIDKIKKEMDEETFYYGGEKIKSGGFASLVYDDKKNIDDEKAMAEIEIEDCIAKMKSFNEPEMSGEVAALLDVSAKIPVEKNAGENIKKGDVKMNFEELKANHPDLFNKVFQAGMEKERERVSAHLKLANTYSASMEIVSKFVSEGKSISDDTVLAEYLTAKAVKEKTEARVEDNPVASTDASGKNALDDSDEFEKALKAEMGVK